MPKDKCRRHLYLGLKIKKISLDLDLPLQCNFCKKIYFSDNPFSIKNLTSSYISICLNCRQKIKCHKCKSKFNIKDFFLVNCVKCEKIIFLCKRCFQKEDIFLLDSLKKENLSLTELKNTIKNFIPNIDKESEEDFNKIIYLILHFDIIFPNIDIEPKEQDDADWWKK